MAAVRTTTGSGAATVWPATEPSLSMRPVRSIVRSLERAGVSRDELLRGAGIDVAELEAREGRVPRSLVHLLYERALDLTGDPALGLHVAEGLEAEAFAPVSGLVCHAATLRQGLESLQRFHGLLGDRSNYELSEHDGAITVRRLGLPDGLSRVRRFVAEMSLSNVLKAMRYFNAGARPEQVCFDYAAPSYRSEYARVFDHAERFEQPFTGIVFDRALMDVPSPNGDADVYDALQALAERRTTRLARRVPYSQRVREFLVQHDWPQRIDVVTVARELGLSVRSLRRRLAAEGTSYGAIEHEALAQVAKRLLRDEGRTIQETAYMMGFSDATTFHRAFKRWTGTTPKAYREAG